MGSQLSRFTLSLAFLIACAFNHCMRAHFTVFTYLSKRYFNTTPSIRTDKNEHLHLFFNLFLGFFELCPLALHGAGACFFQEIVDTGFVVQGFADAAF